MIRIGTIKSAFLLVLGIVAITMVGSAAGDTMGQCDYNQTRSMMQSSIGDYQGNETMMRCMTGEYMADGNCYMAEMDQDTSADQSKLGYTDFCLEKAMELHKLHMEDPSKATNESKMELLNHMMRAHECIMGENVTMEKMDNITAYKALAVSMYGAKIRLNNADFWLKQAMVLHKLQMENPSKATNESRMEMMDNMMYARKCIMGESAAMEMTDKARMDSASVWLKKSYGTPQTSHERFQHRNP
ncbi:hypothetical protein [Methanosarcina horonobensis]|uniref:hypothetical protein n=1 Tax=Methanosarcina horonobensis TaxID=418008 RepID=UPI000A71C562|nr:hypothetical protein [Methanosarcina horonobensis]